MVKNLTLDDVAAKFDKWRNRNDSKKGRIPSELLALVPPLKQQYNISLVAKKLNLSGKHMKKLFAEPAVNFIEMPYSTALPAYNTSSVSCEIIRTDGAILKISVDNAELSGLIKGFLCCN
jgi:hypothetical protein